MTPTPYTGDDTGKTEETEAEAEVDERIDPDAAAIHGHGEARRRLRELGRSEAFIDKLEKAEESPISFARTVAATVKYERDQD